MQAETIKMIIGLGNPGREYDHTRHNIGFEIVDAIAGIYPTCTREIRDCSSLMRTVRFKGETRYLIKPQTFMNLSGDAVRQASQKYGIAPREMLIVYDDLDFTVGTFKIKTNASAGGHNGMASIIEALQTQEIPRMRIGIGAEDARKKQVNYVLTPFDAEQRMEIEKVIEQAKEAVKMVFSRGIGFAMNQMNRKEKLNVISETEKFTNLSTITNPITGGPNIE